MKLKKCPLHPVDIPEDREAIETDGLKFPWKQDPKGYFLVKIKDGQICCGFVNNEHKMELELKGKDPDKMIKEIAKRGLCSTMEHMGYIASELMIAKDALDNDKKYVQR